MVIKYVIHLRNKQFCRCFSDSDLLTNLRFAIREGMQILSVEAV